MSQFSFVAITAIEHVNFFIAITKDGVPCTVRVCLSMVSTGSRHVSEFPSFIFKKCYFVRILYHFLRIKIKRTVSI